MPEVSISAAGSRILKLLVGSRPLTVTELIQATGVTRTAVTEQLNELVASGLVDRAIERLSGRGRPRHLYSATRAALLLLFADSRNLVVPAIWQAISEAGGEQLTHRVRSRVSRSLADHYNTRIMAKNPRERLDRFVGLLAEEGGLVEMSSNGRLVVQKRSCPFISMVDDNRTICLIDLDMMSDVVGCPIRRIACRHDGAPCCVFEVELTA